MDKLLYNYFKECDFNMDIINTIRKIAEVILTFGFMIIAYISNYGILCFIYFFATAILLYLFCSGLELWQIAKTLKQKISVKQIFSHKFRRKLIGEFDKYQKDWITKYLKKNKLDRLEKINLIISELDKKGTKLRYVDPVIIGTLWIKIWEMILTKAEPIIGLINCIAFAVPVTIIISIMIGFIKKEYKMHQRMKGVMYFFSGKERLRHLLLEAALKSKK